MEMTYVYDNYEISPCRRYEELDSPGRFYFEVCEPSEADVWTLYGHIDGQGVEAIGDFPRREDAEQVYFCITGQPFTGSYQAYPRLRLMHTAPRLLAALIDAECFIAGFEDDECQEGINERLARIRAAIAEAKAANLNPGDCTTHSMTIEVRGGGVQDVSNVPPGWNYEIIDHYNAK